MIYLYLTTLIFGAIPVVGRVVTSSADATVFGRALFASLVLPLIISLLKDWKPIPKNLKKLLLFSGILLCVHWVAFFKSLALSSVLIGEVSFSSFPLFTVLLSPFILKESFELKNVLSALGIIIGVVIMCFPIGEPFHYTSGLLWGLFSAFLFSVLTILNRSLRQEIPATLLTWYQNCIVVLCLLPFSYNALFVASKDDYLCWASLGIIGTVGAHTLYNYCLKAIRADVVSLAVGISPGIAVFLGWILLGEIPSTREIVGMLIIVCAGLFSQIDLQRIKSNS